jgi:hypothetical protein
MSPEKNCSFGVVVHWAAAGERREEKNFLARARVTKEIKSW